MAREDQARCGCLQSRKIEGAVGSSGKRKNLDPFVSSAAKLSFFQLPLSLYSALTLEQPTTPNINKRSQNRNPRGGGAGLQQRLCRAPSLLHFLLAPPRPGHHPSRRPPASRRRGLRLQLLVDVLLLVRRRGPGLGQEAGEGAAGRVDGRRRRRRQRRRFQGSGRVGPSGRRGVGAAAAGAAGGRGAPELTVERDHWEG